MEPSKDSLQADNTALVHLADSTSVTAEDFVKSLTALQTEKIESEQAKRNYLRRKELYEKQQREDRVNLAEKTLSKLWNKCDKSKCGHDFSTTTQDKDGYNIILCRICAMPKNTDDNIRSFSYMEAQITNLADRLYQKDKEAGLILTYEEIGGR